MHYAEYQSCIEACGKCAVHCDDAVGHGVDAHEDAHCIQTCLDCSAACHMAVSAMSRHSPNVHKICGYCAAICDVCADECEKMPAEHHQACAKACRECAEECRRMTHEVAPA